jgi:hypothetical protein
MAAAPMPDANAPAVQEAQRQAVASALARGGRASTVIGQQGQNSASRAPVATAATDTYSGKTLGGAQ